MSSNVAPVTNALYSNFTRHILAIMNRCSERAGGKHSFTDKYSLGSILATQALKNNNLQNGILGIH